MRKSPCGSFNRFNAFARSLYQVIGLWAWCASVGAADGLIHHELHVALDPSTASIRVSNRIQIPAGDALQLRFLLGESFSLTDTAPNVERLDARPGSRFREYLVSLDRRPATIELAYTGRIAESASRAEHGMPLAVLDPEGAFLDKAIGWYPQFDSEPVTFRLTADLPADWELVSQGRRQSTLGGPGWDAQAPQDDIYLLAGPYRRYAREHHGHAIEVYLLRPDQPTADRYLGVIGQYLDFYSALIGAYPYPKFAVVENQWQTGYGMPSFTLLGSRVLRLPFILHSSLPHEILHNWWGNGVFIDPAGGNWSEGLTAYLADHLIKEAQGSGHTYRRRTLEKYANFAAQGRDFPLSAFKGRHDDASQAVGYGKALMLFHMLRREMGDAAFTAGLKSFWDTFKFRRASFLQIKAVMEQTAGGPLSALRGVWLKVSGAPILEIDAAAVAAREDKGFVLDLRLRQKQAGPVFPLNVPVAIQLAGATDNHWQIVPMTQKVVRLRQTFATQPLRVDVDPGFDLFRLLAPEERSASLSRLFGAKRQLLVLPAAASSEQRAAWDTLAKRWQRRYRNIEVVTDKTLTRLPTDQAVWLLGWKNRWLERAGARFATSTQSLSEQGLRIRDVDYLADEHLVVVLEPVDKGPGVAFVGAETPTEIAALARKLPHYGRYGRLVFDRDSLANRVKDDLPVLQSPLSRVLGDTDPGPPSLPLPSLTELVGIELSFE